MVRDALHHEGLRFHPETFRPHPEEPRSGVSKDRAIERPENKTGVRPERHLPSAVMDKRLVSPMGLRAYRPSGSPRARRALRFKEPVPWKIPGK